MSGLPIFESQKIKQWDTETSIYQNNQRHTRKT
jgi:hypothetical protein